MTELERLVSPMAIEHLTADEQDNLSESFCRFRGLPTLEQVWELMDEAWRALGCDPSQMDERVRRFYEHPVWMLNGLFIEQDELSLRNRKGFTAWGAQQKPHPAAIAPAKETPNVRYVPELSGEYDLLIATDVFEHVPDPIGLAPETGAHLRLDGQCLIANCFQSVILCHLPQLFHFHYAWGHAMLVKGLEPGEPVVYGRAYRRTGEIDVPAARWIGECACRLHRLICLTPKGRRWIGRGLVRAFCR